MMSRRKDLQVWLSFATFERDAGALEAESAVEERGEAVRNCSRGSRVSPTGERQDESQR